MQASAMHSKACWILAPVFSVFLLCPLFGVDAEESPTGENASEGVIYELNPRPKLTAEEKELMRWIEIDGNDIALYSFDAESMHYNEKDADEIIMTVKAIYNSKPLMEKLKKQYADRLKDDHRVPAYSIMELHIRMKENQYAITSIAIYDQMHDLVTEAIRRPIYQKIPNKSFAESMYKVCQTYIDFTKMHRQKTNKIAKETN